jgi:hypothetical protein
MKNTTATPDVSAQPIVIRRRDEPLFEILWDYGYNENGQFLRHREDGPAVERTDGTLMWYIKGKLHRADGPAILKKNGDEFWYTDDALHRLRSAAIVLKNGAKQWWKKGKFVKTNNPSEHACRNCGSPTFRKLHGLEADTINYDFKCSKDCPYYFKFNGRTKTEEVFMVAPNLFLKADHDKGRAFFMQRDGKPIAGIKPEVYKMFTVAQTPELFKKVIDIFTAKPEEKAAPKVEQVDEQ